MWQMAGATVGAKLLCWGLMMNLYLWPWSSCRPVTTKQPLLLFYFEYSSLFFLFFFFTKPNIQYLICRPSAPDCCPERQSHDPMTSFLSSYRSHFESWKHFEAWAAWNQCGWICLSVNAHTDRLSTRRQLLQVVKRQIKRASEETKECVWMCVVN